MEAVTGPDVLWAPAQLGFLLAALFALVEGGRWVLRRRRGLPDPEPAVGPLIVGALILSLTLSVHLEGNACKCGLFAHGGASTWQLWAAVVHAGLAAGAVVLAFGRMVRRGREAPAPSVAPDPVEGTADPGSPGE